MEEKQMMTNEQLESELQSLRSKATIAKALTYGSGAAMVLCFITALIPLAIAFFSPIFNWSQIFSRGIFWTE